MSEFVYYTPTKVVFGKEVEKKAGEMLAEYGAKKVLVHYGSDRIVKSGLLKSITDTITASGIEFVSLGGVVPNPRISKVYEGIELSRKEGVDFILAIGGGSVIDSAKAIAVGLPYEGDVWDFFERKASPVCAIPTASILTIPAAGSEMSGGMVITKEDGGLKRDLGADFCRCKFSLLNPEFTLTLPDSETVNGAVDILMHTMERYFHSYDELDINDAIAEGLLKSVMKSALILKGNRADMPARESIMWASSLAHNDLTGCGSGGGDWATHQIEHEVSGMFDVAHGAGLSTVWASWARYVIAEIPGRFAKFAKNVMGVELTGDDMADGLRGIKAMENYFSEIGSPINMRELIGRAATDDEIAEMAQKGVYFGRRTLGLAKELKQMDIEAILRAAN